MTLPSKSSLTDPPQKNHKRSRLTPLAVDARGLAELLSVGLRSIRAWDAGGKLPPAFTLGTRRLWSVARVKRWLAWGAPDRQEFLRLEEAERAKRRASR